MADFFKKNYEVLILTMVFAFVVVFSLNNLATKPSIWPDEAFNIEAAQNFSLFGKLDIQTAPGIFSNASYTLVTSNYPAMVPLAGFFSIFGFGWDQARIFMILWLLAALATIYFVTRSFFGKPAAIYALLLCVTFASFFGIGRPVTGEVPGFVFLLLGLYYLIKRENYWLVGLFFGLALAAKPSIYHALPLVFLIYVLFFRKDIIFKIVKFAAGGFLPVLLYFIFIIPDFFSVGGWINIYKLYQNPFIDSPSLTTNFLNNVSGFFSQTTLIYFSLLIFAAVFAFVRHRKAIPEIWQKSFLFFCIYGALVIIYFLRSPGWFRYLFALELLTLILIYPSFLLIFKKWQALVFCGILISVQVVQLFFFSDIAYSTRPQEVSSFVNSRSAQSVGIINLSQVAAFIPPEKKYHVISDVRQIGENPLSFSDDKLPELIVLWKGDEYAVQYQDVLDKKYALLKEFGVYKVYQRI
ncbi:MAG: glycosyltransferase family 39 protein [bacterium]